jgi:hypothetical protein
MTRVVTMFKHIAAPLAVESTTDHASNDDERRVVQQRLADIERRLLALISSIDDEKPTVEPQM